jgi:hypothetical protein
VSGRAYSAPGYAASLSEFGLPRPLPRSGGWLLEREIADGVGSDLMGPYPLFGCADWAGLADDLEELAGPVSVVLVADPLAEVGERELRRAFPDRVVPFKRHHVRDLDAPAKLPEHHRRHLRRSGEAVEVEVCADPLEHLDDWTSLYAELAERHGLTGISAFSREAFRAQLALPGMVAVRAERAGATVGMALWLEDAPNAWYHLAAYSTAGYEVSASYALFAVALDRLRELGVTRVDLGGAAGATDADDGLTRFKRGWATGERTAHLCGRVLDRQAYDRLAGAGDSDWFPAYREPAVGSGSLRSRPSRLLAP